MREQLSPRNVHIITASSSDREYPSTGSDSFKLGDEGVSRCVQLAAIVFADHGVARFGMSSTIVWRARTRRPFLRAPYDAGALLVGTGAKDDVDLYSSCGTIKALL